MKLATIRIDGTTAAARIDGEAATVLPEPDLDAVLRRAGWHEYVASATGRQVPIDLLDYAPLIRRPDKIICVGLNYRTHIIESSLPIPEYPILFSKYPEALIGANDDICMPPESDRIDWEAELAVVIGKAGRRIERSAAEDHIAGYAVLNDISVRDWQLRTSQWLPGKTFEGTTPFGPWLVTSDSSHFGGRELVCEIDGEQMQHANTSDLVFDPLDLVAFISTILTLNPGDVIATGTPGGIGGARTPKRYIVPGETVMTRIEGLGECRNRSVRADNSMHLESADGEPIIASVSPSAS